MERGATLIEVIIYIALLGILLTGTFTTALALIDGAERNTDTIFRRQEAAFIREKIRFALQASDDSSISQSGTVLTIRTVESQHFDASENPIRLYVENRSLMMRRGTHEAMPLQAERFLVQSFEVSEDDGWIYIQFQLDDESFSLSVPIE